MSPGSGRFRFKLNRTKLQPIKQTTMPNKTNGNLNPILSCNSSARTTKINPEAKKGKLITSHPIRPTVVIGSDLLKGAAGGFFGSDSGQTGSL
jgi:hypothetical protein